jgi:ribose transport system substrate-binding protein
MRCRSRRAMMIMGGVVAACLAAATTACGHTPKSSGRTPPRVTFVVAATQLNFATEMVEGFRSGVEEVGGVQDEVLGPPMVDGTKQLEFFRESTRTSKAGISVFTLDPDLFARPMADASHSGIPMIAVDNPPPLFSNVKLYVGNDNYQLGRTLADEVIAKLPADTTGKIVIGTSAPGVPVLDRRASGIRDRLRERLPRAVVLGPFDSQQGPGPNLAAWKTMVAAHPDAVAFLGTGDADGYNLAAIRRSTKGTWLAGAFDLDPKSLQAVKEGNLVLVSPEHYVKGALAGRLQAQHAKDGKPLPEGWLYTPGLAVDSDNIDEIIARQASPAAKAKALAPTVDKILGDRSYLRPLKDAG